MTNNLQRWLHTEMFKIITVKNIVTYNVNRHCNLLYAVKVWNCLNFIRKRRQFFFLGGGGGWLIKLLFIKERGLINVNVNLEGNLEGQG